MSLELNEQALATLTSGLMAGLGVALSFVAVPAIKASSDPLPAWKMVYKNGSKIALTSIFITTGAGIRLYLKSEDIRYAIMSGMIFSIAPYTLVFMKPTNSALFAIEDESSRRDKGEMSKVRRLISKWNQLQYVRTALGLGAFVLNVLLISKKLSA